MVDLDTDWAVFILGCTGYEGAVMLQTFGTERDAELPARLRCEGAELIRPNGKPIILRGVSMGSWGEDFPEDAPAIRAMSANVVRVLLRWWCPGRNGSESRDNDGFALLLQANVAHWLALIDAVIATGAWVIAAVDSNCGQNGLQDAETAAYCDRKGTWPQGRNFFTDPSMRRIFATVVWPALATQLRMRERIALLELQPEPAGGRGKEYAPAVQQLYLECIEGIRDVDSDTPFLIGARNAYDIKLAGEAILPERYDVVYTGNLLNQYVTDPAKFDESLTYLLDVRDQWGVPVFVQQMGRKSAEDRDLAHMKRAARRLKQERVGYAWWEWKNHVVGNPDGYGLNYPAGSGLWIAKDDEIAVLTHAWA